jgi:hypothetical protein
MHLDRDEIIWISIALAARAKFYEDQGRGEYGARYDILKARWDNEMLWGPYEGALEDEAQDAELDATALDFTYEDLEQEYMDERTREEMRQGWGAPA